MLPSGNLTWLLNMAIEIVDFPTKNGGSFHSYVTVYQRVHMFHMSGAMSFAIPEMVYEENWV